MTIPNPPAVSVVCPFFNEEAIIETSLRRMIANLTRDFGSDWELVLVDDGSRDRSRALLVAALDALDEPRVRVIGYDRNRGRGRALKTGIDAARAPIVVTTEADSSWGDDIARRLYDALQRDPAADFIIASPHLPGGGLANVPFSRILLTKIGNHLIRLFFTSAVTMNTGMTRAYRREVIVPLVTLEDGKEFHLEVLLKLLVLGFSVREIPATIAWPDHRQARADAPKRKSSTRIFKTIGTHLRFMAIAQPVQYFAVFAALAATIGLGFVSAAVWNLLSGGPAVFYAIVGLIMGLSAVIFSGFSVVFHQLRALARDQWMRAYPAPLPPTRPAARVFRGAGADAKD